MESNMKRLSFESILTHEDKQEGLSPLRNPLR